MGYTRGFWRDVHARWPTEATRLRAVTRSVLRLLRQRLPPEEGRQLFGQLPTPLADLAEEPGIVPRKRTLEPLGEEGFYTVVAEENALPVDAAAAATHAVFRAMKGLLPEPTIAEVAGMLRAGLGEAWLRA